VYVAASRRAERGASIVRGNMAKVAFLDVGVKNEVMEAIRFEVEVGPDQVIHVPEAIKLPPGPAEIMVTPKVQGEAGDDVVSTTRDWLLKMAAEAEQDSTPLPADLAENHDFYAHGKPRE